MRSNVVDEPFTLTASSESAHTSRASPPPERPDGSPSEHVRLPAQSGAVPERSDQWDWGGALRTGRAGVGATRHRRGPHRPPEERVGAIRASDTPVTVAGAECGDDGKQHVNLAGAAKERRRSRSPTWRASCGPSENPLKRRLWGARRFHFERSISFCNACDTRCPWWRVAGRERAFERFVNGTRTRRRRLSSREPLFRRAPPGCHRPQDRASRLVSDHAPILHHYLLESIGAVCAAAGNAAR